ncbi:MAG TPA: hypothetical protein ENN41_09230 [Sediminispirochaeta sp.]|nr:hypothetical protein [Sediminispirochaeta sp.]
MNKYIGPVLSAVVFIIAIAVFGFFYFFVISELAGARIIGLLFVGAALVGMGIMVAVLIQRIKEIKKGEEDDLGEY